MKSFFSYKSLGRRNLTAQYQDFRLKNIFLSLETVKYGISPLTPLKDAFYKIFIFTLLIGIPVLIVTIFTQLFVGGITFSFKAVSWKNSKINPIEWMKRTFSVKGLVELSKSVLKVVLLFGVGASIASFTFFFVIGYLSKNLSKYAKSEKVWKVINIFIVSFMTILTLFIISEMIR